MPETLVDRLGLMFDWYTKMVDEHTARFLYLYEPRQGLAVSDGESIRDIAAVWNVEVLGAFLGRADLSYVVRHSLTHFDQRVITRDGYTVVAPRKAASSIAYNAFLVLALARSNLTDRMHKLTLLADGIVHQQRADGSYQVFFDATQDSGEELYPAEAILALLEGLADAYAIAAATDDHRLTDYRRCIRSALGFLVRAQRLTNCTARERGGFGASLSSREQRIDVTGHVASGFIKSIERGITEP